MKRVIITGATGAVGTALIKACIEKQIEVLVFVREDSKRNSNIPKHPLVKTMNCSLEELAEVVNPEETCYDVFYHLAWAGTTGEARNDMYLQNMNVKYALDAVGAAKRFGCHTFVGIGSQAEYGRVEGLLHYDTPVKPEMGYGIGKLCAGQMTREYAHQLGLKHEWVRILSIYGPYDGMQSMVMSTVQKLLNGEVPRFTKGEQMWDYLYSEDAADALVGIGERGKDGSIYVLGSGQASPLSEYIEIIRDKVNPDMPIELGAIPYAKRQVMHLCADISNLKEDTGFHAKTSFEDGIEKILMWYKEEIRV